MGITFGLERIITLLYPVDTQLPRVLIKTLYQGGNFQTPAQEANLKSGTRTCTKLLSQLLSKACFRAACKGGGLIPEFDIFSSSVGGLQRVFKVGKDT